MWMQALENHILMPGRRPRLWFDVVLLLACLFLLLSAAVEGSISIGRSIKNSVLKSGDHAPLDLNNCSSNTDCK